MTSRTFMQRFKAKLLARGDDWSCHYCGVKFIPNGVKYGAKGYYAPRYSPAWSQAMGNAAINGYTPLPGYSNQPTIDHLIPRSKGGTNDLSNLVFACRWCNSSKGNRRD